MWMLIYRTQYAEINRTVVVRRLTGRCVRACVRACAGEQCDVLHVVSCSLSAARCDRPAVVRLKPTALGLVHRWALLDDLG